MNVRDNGGLAFPVNEINETTGDIYAQHLGMTLRDYFAAKALGNLAREDIVGYRDNAARAELIRLIAQSCWDLADAMLEARK